MRIISQDGTIDMPYEEVLITLGCSGDKREYHINGHLIYQGGSSSVKIATYSTEEKAKKAMEMLRDAYIGMPIVMQNVDVSEDVSMEFERFKKCGIVVQTENQPSKIECISNAIFQFPADEELE